MTRQCHKAGDKLYGHYEGKTGFLHEQFEGKMPQNKFISVTHTCTTYYRKCLRTGDTAHTDDPDTACPDHTLVTGRPPVTTSTCITNRGQVSAPVIVSK